MWIIVKYKIHELNFLKKNFNKVLGSEPLYFNPRIKYSRVIQKKFKNFQRSILEGFIICFHNKFNNSSILNILKYTKGLVSILDGFRGCQDEISNFIKRCRMFEDKDGFLRQDFFNSNNLTKAKFVSGPFTNLVFEILSKESGKIKILMGKFKTTISRNSSFLYRPV